MRSSRYRARFANRILSKRFNNPRRRRFCFPETPQDRLCKTSRYARILVPCSRHFPLILSIVPSVRNSARVLFPRRHNRAKLPGTEREIRERERKNQEGILSTTSLFPPTKSYFESAPNSSDTLPQLDSLRSETRRKIERMEGNSSSTISFRE